MVVIYQYRSLINMPRSYSGQPAQQSSCLQVVKGKATTQQGLQGMLCSWHGQAGCSGTHLPPAAEH
jgi:hypothetical protein